MIDFNMIESMEGPFTLILYFTSFHIYYYTHGLIEKTAGKRQNICVMIIFW